MENLMGQVLLVSIIETFKQTYQEFLKDMELKDTAVVQVGFYTGVLTMIHREPIPEKDVHEELVKHFEQVILESIEDNTDDLLGSIKATYMIMQEGAAERYHASHDCEVVHIGKKRWQDWMR